ncbi:MAG: hypothetical protein ACOCOC_08925 [Prevotella sp.]
MAIRIDENTIFEDGRMKKVSAAKVEAEVESKAAEKSDAKSEDEAENVEPKTKDERKPKASVKGEEA